MATPGPGQYLVNNTVNDCNALLLQLRNVKQLVMNITERMEAMGVAALAGYEWPEGYTQQDFVDLYQALNALPGSIVENPVRDALFDLVGHIQ